MIDPSSSDWCPYPGLASFQTVHQPYYFGREADARVLAENVLARRTVVLVGPSGTGKTSLLNVGLPQALHGYGIAARIVCRQEWNHPHAALAWLAAETKQSKITPDRPLLILILDQFEEYFYYRDSATIETLERALAAVLDRDDMEAHVIVSLRDDAFVRLEALRAELPELLDTIIELEPLDDAGVRRAIEGPIEVYNERWATLGASNPVRMDFGFVESVIEALRGALSCLSGRQASPRGKTSIELPFLQLTLGRLWEQVREEADGRLMSAAMLDELGGVDGIVKEHVQRKLGNLSVSEKNLASAIFHYMVTPSGGKFAYMPDDLAVLVAESSSLRTTADKIKKTLEVLTQGDSRLLRQRDVRFELFHDILARPILDWRAEYMDYAPFACLIDVFYGKPFYLFGSGQLFGRCSVSPEDGPTTLSTRSVSRYHLLVLKTYEMLDLRSRFGTTVNAQPVPFGEPCQLSSGDVLGLASTAVLRFVSIENVDETAVSGAVGFETSPDDAWALLIDGSNRCVVPIRSEPAYLTFDRRSRICVVDAPDAESFAAVLLRSAEHERRAYLTALAGHPELLMVHRADAFHIHEEAIEAGKPVWIDLREWTGGRAKAGPHGGEAAKRGVFRTGERWFEIIRGPALAGRPLVVTNTLA